MRSTSLPAVCSAYPLARAQVGDAELAFGMVGPFSGAAKEMGKEIRTGIEVAFAAQNEAGGVHGRRLRLVAVDDGFEPARTAAAMRDLVEVKKVLGILGNVGTATAEVAVPCAMSAFSPTFGRAERQRVGPMPGPLLR